MDNERYEWLSEIAEGLNKDGIPVTVDELDVLVDQYCDADIDDIPMRDAIRQYLKWCNDMECTIDFVQWLSD